MTKNDNRHQARSKSSLKLLLRRCPVCDCTQGETLHHQRFAVVDGYVLPDQYDLVACVACSMIFADTPATQADYEKFYASCSIYEQPADTLAGTTSSEDMVRLEQAGEIFASYIPSRTDRILDVGCANGGLLQVLRRLGYENLTGVDPSPMCVENTRQTGARAYCGDLGHLPAEAGVFDVVILTSVLEHVLDVKGAIAALVRVCSEGGRIFLEVPDAGSYADYLHSPFQDISTEHVNHFSKVTLRNLMARSGFVPIFERQVIVPGHSGLLLGGLEAGYERGPSQPTQDWLSDDTFRGKMETYLSRSRAMMKAIDQQLRRVLGVSPEVIVWGTGQLTMKLLCDTALKDANIAAFVDGNPMNAGKSIGGVPILRPEELKNQVVPIVIGTLLQTAAIQERINALGLPNPIVMLEAVLPLTEGTCHMPHQVDGPILPPDELHEIKNGVSAGV